MNILDKVSNIEQEVKNSQDFHRLNELLVDLEKKLKEAPAQELQTFGIQLQQKSLIIHSTAISTFGAFSVGWKAKKTEYKDKQLEDGEKLAETLLDVLSKYGPDNFPADAYGDNYVSKSEASLNTLKGQIEEEKKRRREDPGDDSSLDKQIEKLKNEIKKLEEKLMDPTNSNDLKQQYKDQISALRNSLAEKEREKLGSEKGDFPTKLVLISVGVGAVVVLLLVVLYLQLSRRNQRY